MRFDTKFQFVRIPSISNGSSRASAFIQSCLQRIRAGDFGKAHVRVLFISLVRAKEE